MSESRVRENRTHGSMRRREAPWDSRLSPCGSPAPPADPSATIRVPTHRAPRTQAVAVTIRLRASAPLGIPSASRLGELGCVAQHLSWLAREFS